jgi:hypothetical protein
MRNVTSPRFSFWIRAALTAAGVAVLAFVWTAYIGIALNISALPANNQGVIAAAGPLTFCVGQAPGSAHRSVIMIDDVYTLGRMSAACREVLVSAGARNVVVICIGATSK